MSTSKPVLEVAVFRSLGRTVAAHARAVFVGSLVLLIASAVLGFGVFGRLQGQGFDDPSSGSTRASQLLRQHFGGDPNLIFLVTARTGTVDDPAVAQAGSALAARLAADPRLTQVTAYWTDRAPTLRSRDAKDALILVRVRGDDDQASSAAKHVIDDDGDAGTAAAQVRVGGSLGTDVGGQVGKDIGLAESIAVPITLLLLVIVFGSLVSAALPLAVSLVGIFGSFATLFVISLGADVSIFAVNLVTALGLGLGIDYALLMVSRFREELEAGSEVAEAVARTVATAGRTIAFSALTVAAALSSMLVFPVYFLRSFAYGGISVTLFAALGALLLLPALLTLIGHRVDSGRVPGLTRVRGAEAPFWGRLAGAVMRRPVAALPVLALLVALAVPLLHVSFGTPDDRVLPRSNPAHQVGDVLRDDFATQPSTIDVVLSGSPAPQAVATYARRLAALPGVQQVTAPTVAGDLQRLRLTTGLETSSGPAQDLVRAVRAVPAPAPAVVGGETAELVDAKHAIAQGLLPAGVIIVITSLVVLFLFTGSVVQPVRALVGNALTLGATLGAVVLVFQDGHLHGLLGFTPSPTNTDMPVLLFCVAFGLSMDYEVFLVSRIKELHDAGAPTPEAVRHGLARTGRIVSTAAALLAVSFFAFGTSKVSFIQLFGLGTGLAILLDATLVRGVLVPASMRLFGEASWWAPAPLRRLHRRIGLAEG